MNPISSADAADRLYDVRRMLAVVEAALSSRPSDWHPKTAEGMAVLLDKAMDDLQEVIERIHPVPELRAVEG